MIARFMEQVVEGQAEPHAWRNPRHGIGRLGVLLALLLTSLASSQTNKLPLQVPT